MCPGTRLCPVSKDPTGPAFLPIAGVAGQALIATGFDSMAEIVVVGIGIILGAVVAVMDAAAILCSGSVRKQFLQTDRRHC